MVVPVDGVRRASVEQEPIWRHHLTHESGVSTVALAGELDLAGASNVQALLFEQAQAPGVRDVLVDLADVVFLDSTAVGALVSAFNHTREQGRGFAVVNPSAAALRVLALTGLDEILIRR